MKRSLLAILFLLVSAVTFAQQGGEDYIIISKIDFQGNKITKPSTIYRELLFREGDTIYLNVGAHRFHGGSRSGVLYLFQTQEDDVV